MVGEDQSPLWDSPTVAGSRYCKALPTEWNSGHNLSERGTKQRSNHDLSPRQVNLIRLPSLSQFEFLSFIHQLFESLCCDWGKNQVRQRCALRELSIWEGITRLAGCFVSSLYFLLHAGMFRGCSGGGFLIWALCSSPV